MAKKRSRRLRGQYLDGPGGKESDASVRGLELIIYADRILIGITT